VTQRKRFNLPLNLKNPIILKTSIPLLKIKIIKKSRKTNPKIMMIWKLM